MDSLTLFMDIHFFSGTLEEQAHRRLIADPTLLLCQTESSSQVLRRLRQHLMINDVNLREENIVGSINRGRQHARLLCL